MDLPITIENLNPEPGRWIARTMTRLATSTPQQPNEVRVLVYGQSISKQAWWLKVKHALQDRYPHAKLVMENWAIGGFHSPRLRRCAAHDLRCFYPDLVIFHDYGPRDDYEAIIRTIRAETTAEVLVQSDHVGAEQHQAWHDEHSFEWLPDLCRRYKLDLVNVRGAWQRYLEVEDLEPRALLRDQVHLNDRGNALMAEIVKAHLIHEPAYGDDPQGLVTTLRAGRDFDLSGGKCELEVEGNRVDLVASGPLRARIRLDGEDPATLRASYVAERPWLNRSWPPKVGLPVRIDVGDGPEMGFEAGAWTLTPTRVIDNGAVVYFELMRQEQGFEPAAEASLAVSERSPASTVPAERGAQSLIVGEGSSEEDFVSDDGQIVIPQSAWFVRETPEFFHMLPAVEEGDAITFNVRYLSRSAITAPARIEAPVTLIHVAGSGPHRLCLTNEDDGDLPVSLLQVHRPPDQTEHKQSHK
jgi:hypothetical protein